jgi:dolichyl-phosphate beta-glucosyltransferase
MTVSEYPQFLISVVVPVFNEENSLVTNMAALAKFLDGKGLSYEIILVDDGSKDQTWMEIQRCTESWATQVRGLRMNGNQGKGASVAAGMKKATGQFLFFMDADLPYDLEVLWASLRILQGDDVGVVVGDRELPQSESRVDYSWKRVGTKRVFSWLTSKLVIQGFPDTQCGFKGFSHRVAQELFPKLMIRGFSFDVELLVMAVENGIRVARVPVKFLRHQGSSLNLMLDPIRMGLDLMRIAYRKRMGHYRWDR